MSDNKELPNRTLNKLKGDSSFVRINGCEFTLIPGRYIMEVSKSDIHDEHFDKIEITKLETEK